MVEEVKLASQDCSLPRDVVTVKVNEATQAATASVLLNSMTTRTECA